MVKRCAEQAHSMGYVYFSVQFHGECWAGDENTANSYYLNGYSDNCHEGHGGAASNFVYKIGGPEGESVWTEIIETEKTLILYISLISKKRLFHREMGLFLS